MAPDKISVLENKLSESEEALEKGDDDKVVRLNTEFHDLLYKSSKSKKLVEMINTFRDYFYLYRPALAPHPRWHQAIYPRPSSDVGSNEEEEPKIGRKPCPKASGERQGLILREMDQGRTIP